MIESQRRAYLEAMDINVWLGKAEAADQIGLVIGPGSGSTLLLCRAADESATRLAADISRYLADGPVWAWPCQEASQQYPSLEHAIGTYLFTRVVVFGQSLAAQLFNGQPPQILGSAAIIVARGVNVLEASADARRELWQKLS
jgi:hypothetical protein